MLLCPKLAHHNNTTRSQNRIIWFTPREWIKSSLDGTDSSFKNNTRPLQEKEQLSIFSWQREVDAIGEKLAQIKSIRTYQIQVEAVLDSQQVQIAPAWFDFPAGAEVSKSRASAEPPSANFLQHVGLDWQVLVGEELISYSDYKRRVVLQKHGMALDKEGEIVVGGVRLKDTMPQVAYDLFLKGLEAELATAEVEVPHSDAIARPDKAKMELTERLGAQVRSLINDLFKQRNLIADGTNGCSLVERPVELLAAAIERVRAKGHEPSFKNNSQLIHSAVFGFIKEKTGRSWSELTFRTLNCHMAKLGGQARERSKSRGGRLDEVIGANSSSKPRPLGAGGRHHR